MIDLSRAALHAEGVTVFPDHAEPTRFHYLPDRPRLRTGDDGAPEVRLLKYRLDAAAGPAGAGTLSLTVDLHVDDDVLGRLAGRLARQFALDRAPQLALAVAESGRCQVIALDRGPAAPPAAPGVAGADGPAAAPLVEHVLGGAQPALYGDEAATFVLVLSSDEAQLVEAALRGGGLPVGVVYALDVLALRPALRAEITARWADVYHYYENRLHGGKLLVGVDIGATVEALVEQQALTVKIDDLVPEAGRDDAYRQAIDRAQQYVLQELFQPTLGTQPPAADGGSGDGLAAIGTAIKDLAGFFSLTYTLRSVDRSELETLSYRLDAASAERLTLAPQGVLTALLARPDGAPIDLAKIITEVAPGPSPEMRFDVGAAVDLAAEEIDHLEVLLRYGDRRVDLLLDAATPRRGASFFYDAALGPALARSYEVHFRADADAAPEVLRAAETQGAGRVIRVDPRELYQRLTLRPVARGVPFDRFPQVIVDLAADDPAAGWSRAQTVVLDAAHPEGAFTVRAPLGASVRLRRRLRYVSAQGVETRRDWDDLEPGVVVVGDPFPDVLDVRVVGSARFGTEVARLVVELRPAAHPAQVATRVLTRDAPFATWSLPLAAPDDPGERAWEYRVTVHTVRAEVRAGPWLPGPPDGGTLVVGEGFARLRDVRLQFLGRTLAALGLAAIKVRFQFDDPQADLHAEDEVLVQDTSRPVAWQYPVADEARQGYEYQLTVVRADGQLDVRAPVPTSDLLVVVPLPLA